MNKETIDLTPQPIECDDDDCWKSTIKWYLYFAWVFVTIMLFMMVVLKNDSLAKQDKLITDLTTQNTELQKEVDFWRPIGTDVADIKTKVDAMSKYILPVINKKAVK